MIIYNHLVAGIAACLVALASSCGGGRHADTADTDLADEAIVTGIVASDLSNQRVTAFAEDALGYVWIGTFRGLNRYNSHDFRQYFCTDAPSDLPDNQINDLFRDSRGRLWVATISGIALHNDLDKFDLVPFGDTKPHCRKIAESASGNIYALCSSQLGRYNEEQGRFDIVIDVSGTHQRDYRSACSGPGGRIWLCASDVIDIFDSDNYSLVETIELGAQAICFYKCPTRGRLWVGTSSGVKLIDLASRKITDLPPAIASVAKIARGYVNTIHRYDANTLLINTVPDGLYLYNHVTDEVKHQGDDGFPFEVPDFVNCLFTDSHGNLWIGSYDSGFEVRSVGKKRFNDNYFLVSHTAGRSISSVAADSRDRLWMGIIPSQLCLYDPNTGKLTDNCDPDGPSAKTSALYVDRNDDVWLCDLLGNSVRRCRYDGSRVHVVARYDVAAPLTITADSEGNIWIGSSKGTLTRISIDDGSVATLSLPSSVVPFVSGLVSVEPDCMMAAAFMNPLYAIDTRTLKLTEGPIDAVRMGEIMRRSVFIPTDIYFDSYNDLWIGTVGNGLLRYHFEADSIEHMHGLPCTDIASLQEDRQGNMWVSSQYGLSSFDRTTGRFSNYFAADGTGGNQYYDRSSCILSDGTMVFGGTHGITIFNPLDVSARRNVPVVFDDLKIHNRSVDPAVDPGVIASAIPTASGITLSHDQNGFAISYAALDYENSEHSHYYYRLDGHDRYWIDARNSNEAYYANLPPGRYTFRVKVADNITSEASEIAIPITIKPAPWLSWWAIVIYVILGAVVVYFIGRLRYRYIAEARRRQMAEQEREQQQRLNDMNMSFFANIAHEFRTPLTMISGPITQLESSAGITGHERRLINVVQRNVSRMLRLINQLMDFNKLENDTLRLQVEHIDLMVYLRHIAENFSVNAEEKGITLHTSGLEDTFVTWIDVDKLEKIATNLLSNAVKFTPRGGQIDMDFDVVDASEAARIAHEGGAEFTPTLPCLKLTVTDTGPGLPPESINLIFDRYFQLRNHLSPTTTWGTGIGLYYSRALANLHHGCLVAGNRPASDGHTGSVFTLLLPVGEEAYAADDHVTASEQVPLPPVAPSAEPAAEPSADPDRQRPTLLVVDDDTEVIHYLRELLSPYYEVLASFDAESAYATATESHPDLIMSDVVMPGTDGYALCRRIKEDLQICHTPVVLVTAKATIENQVQGLNTGADAYVTKPFDPQYLLALIKSQLENRHRARSIISNATETSDIAPEVLSGADKAFMTELYALMENELSNTELDITSLTDRLHISRTKLYYKIKGLTGDTPAAFFKTYKLNRAAELIAQGRYTMAEIADITGFSTQAHFSTSFKKHFGVSPSAWKPGHDTNT